jgi:hypothetical protein
MRIHLNSTVVANMKILFRQGIISKPELPSMLYVHGGAVHLRASGSPIILAFAHGKRDYIHTITDDVNSAWTLPSGDAWLYWDINQITGLLTYGITTDPSPLYYDWEAPSSPVQGQHFFNLSDNKMRVWTGGKWIERIRVFAAQWKNGALNELGVYSQANVVGTRHAGSIVFDAMGMPVYAYGDDSDRTRYFATNVKSADIAFSNGYNVALDKQQLNAFAAESLGQHKCVILGDDGLVYLASRDGDKPAIGITDKAYAVGEKVKLVTHGFVENKTDWAWTHPENTNLFVDSIGGLTTNLLNDVSSQIIAIIVAPHTIFVNIQEKITVLTGAAPELTVTPTVTPYNTVTPTLTPTNTITPTVTPTLAVTGTPAVTTTVTPTVTVTVTPTGTPAVTNPITPTITPTVTVTPTTTVSLTPTVTVTPTTTVTPTVTPTMTVTPTVTPTVTATVTPTVTPSPSDPNTIDPSGIPDLVSWQDNSDESTLFQNNNLTNPVTVPGQTIATAYNKASAGNVIWYAQGGGNNEMTYASEVQNSLTASGCLSGVQSDWLFGANSGSSRVGSLTQQNGITILYACRAATTDRRNPILNITSNANFPADTVPQFTAYLDNRAGSLHGASMIDSSGTEVYSILPANPGTEWVIGGAIKDGSNITSRLNGVEGTTVSGVGDGIVNYGADVLWNRYTSGYEQTIAMAGELLIYNRVLTPIEVESVEAYLANRWE